MIVKEKKNVEYCSQCPFCESKRIYTADSFETVFELFCKKLNERIYTIDWNEEGKPIQFRKMTDIFQRKNIELKSVNKIAKNYTFSPFLT